MRVFCFVAGKRRDGVPRINHEAFIDKSPGESFLFWPFGSYHHNSALFFCCPYRLQINA